MIIMINMLFMINMTIISNMVINHYLSFLFCPPDNAADF